MGRFNQKFEQNKTLFSPVSLQTHTCPPHNHLFYLLNCPLSCSCLCEGWVHLCAQCALHPLNPFTDVFCEHLQDGGHVGSYRLAAHLLRFFMHTRWKTRTISHFVWFTSAVFALHSPSFSRYVWIWRHRTSNFLLQETARGHDLVQVGPD